MAKLVEMLELYAGPDAILDKGKTYTITDQLYTVLATAQPPCCVIVAAADIDMKRHQKQAQADPGDTNAGVRPKMNATPSVDDHDAADDDFSPMKKPTPMPKPK